MRVLYDYQTFSNPGYGGISRYFVELARRIGRSPGVEASVLCPILRSPLLAASRSHLHVTGIDLSAMRLPRRAVLATNRLLSAALEPLSHAALVHETYYAERGRGGGGPRLVTTIHDCTPERHPQLFPEWRQHQTAKQKALDRADWVICVSESTRRDLLDLYRVDASRLTVIPLGCSLQPASSAQTTAHDRLNRCLPESSAADEAPLGGAPYFLFVGARYHYKNFTNLLRAFGLSTIHRTHRLVSFTTQPFSADEWAACDAAGVPRDRLMQVAGDDRSLARWYAGAEALVFPSLYEGFGIPLLEAMRCGCPVIASRASSLPEVAGEAALYCEPTEAASIAQAMESLAGKPELRRLLVAEGYQREQLYSWDRCAVETLAVYHHLLPIASN